MSPPASRDWFQVYGGQPGGGGGGSGVPSVLAGNTLIIPAATAITTSYSRNVNTGLPTAVTATNNLVAALCNQFAFFTIPGQALVINCATGSTVSVTQPGYPFGMYYGRYGISYFLWGLQAGAGQPGTFFYNNSLTGAGTTVTTTQPAGQRTIGMVLPNPYSNIIYVFQYAVAAAQFTGYSIYTASAGVLTLQGNFTLPTPLPSQSGAGQIPFGLEPINGLIVLAPILTGIATDNCLIYKIGTGGVLSLVQSYNGGSLGSLGGASFSKDGKFIYQSTTPLDTTCTVAPISATGIGAITNLNVAGPGGGGITCGTGNYVAAMHVEGSGTIYQVNPDSSLTVSSTFSTADPGGGFSLSGDIYA
jgi:hypothetical protein